MPDLFAELAEDWRKLTRHGHHAENQAPAMLPVTITAADAAQPTGGPMSIVTDVEQGWQATKNEMAKFEANLPGLLERAKSFEASPFAALAEKAASAILPPEAVAVAVKSADSILNDLISLYQPAQPAAPAEPAAPAPAQ